MTTDVVLASTTLPQLFQPPIIDGEGYWDGGYIANPAIEPMVRENCSHDVLIVQLGSPRRYRMTPSAERRSPFQGLIPIVYL